jgi:hypothetical protein
MKEGRKGSEGMEWNGMEGREWNGKEREGRRKGEGREREGRGKGEGRERERRGKGEGKEREGRAYAYTEPSRAEEDALSTLSAMSTMEQQRHIRLSIIRAAGRALLMLLLGRHDDALEVFLFFPFWFRDFRDFRDFRLFLCFWEAVEQRHIRLSIIRAAGRALLLLLGRHNDTLEVFLFISF